MRLPITKDGLQSWLPLEQVGVFLEWLADRGRAVFYLSGPAGSGKTSLLDTFVRRLGEAAVDDREILRLDFSDSAVDIRTGLLTLNGLASDGIPRILILDGVYNAEGVTGSIEALLLAHPGSLKIVVASRTRPSGAWLVSPVLRQSTTHHLIGRDENSLDRFDRDDNSPEQVVRRYLLEVDDPTLLPYLETAAAAWRFDRDLLYYLNGGIRPMAFRKILQLSFVHQDQIGLYLDPVLRQAMLDRLGRDKAEKLRRGIHLFSLGESSNRQRSPIHWLNTLYTLEGEEAPRRLFELPPPGASVQIIDRLPGGMGSWSQYLNNKETAEGQLPGCVFLGSFLDGECQGAAAVSESFVGPPGIHRETGGARFLRTLAVRPGRSWAAAHLVRYLLVDNIMKADIVTAPPRGGLAEMLGEIGGEALNDEGGCFLLGLKKDFPKWLDSILYGQPTWKPKDSEIVEATRKTLQNWRQPGMSRSLPLLEMLEHAGAPDPGTAVGFDHFESIMSSVLRSYHDENPRMARIIDAVYLRHSTRMRDAAKELGIPERTLYREIQRSLYQIGKNLLRQMGRNSIHDQE
ncbi:MAG: hypothetical protein HPY50_08550 [Firmicutes bacterium]|nr:hypothetical protein [Bacillota bacterium]